MSLAISEPGDLTPDEAQVLTAKIKAHVTQAWLLITEAHDRRAYKALGYVTFAAYVEAEFDMKRAHAYRLINQGRVIAELAQAAGVSPDGDIAEVLPVGDTTPAPPVRISEAAARDLKPRLADAAATVRDEVAAGATPAEAIDTAVARHRRPIEPPADPVQAAAVTAAALDHIAAANPDVADGFARVAAHKAIAATDRLLKLDPSEAARLLPGTDYEHLDRWADRIATWADQFRRARHPLHVVEGEAR